MLMKLVKEILPHILLRLEKQETQLEYYFSYIFSRLLIQKDNTLFVEAFWSWRWWVCLALLSLYSFPFPHVFVYLCPTGAWWVRVSDASAASSENLHTPPFMWHGLNFNPKYSAKDRKLTKVRNSYSALAFFLLHRTGVNSRKSPRRAVKM